MVFKEVQKKKKKTFNYQDPQLSKLLLPTYNRQHCHGSMTQGHPKHVVFLLVSHQEVHSSLMLHHDTQVIHLMSSHRVDMYRLLSLHHKKGENNTKKYFESNHTHITFITVYCYNRSILLLIINVNLLLCLIYQLNFIMGMYV